MSSPPNFDRLARIYHWMEFATFGPYLWRARTVFLSSLAGHRNALVLGDGDGRFTALLLRANPEIRIDAVDASPAMLQALLRRAGPNVSRLRTWCADVRSFRPPNPPYDLIVTHFFLDCLTTEEIRSLAENIRKAATPQPIWLISEFAIPSGGFGAILAKPVVSFLYSAFGLLTGLAVRNLPDHHSALRSSGFILQKRHAWLGGLLAGELWSAQVAK